MQSLPRSAAYLLAFLLTAVGTVNQASAINIVIQLQDEGENPSWDSGGGHLRDIFEAAAIIWERLLPDSMTYEIDVYYEDLPDCKAALKIDPPSASKNDPPEKGKKVSFCA
jgi:hypothetical protein